MNVTKITVKHSKRFPIFYVGHLFDLKSKLDCRQESLRYKSIN